MIPHVLTTVKCAGKSFMCQRGGELCCLWWFMSSIELTQFCRIPSINFSTNTIIREKRGGTQWSSAQFRCCQKLNSVCQLHSEIIRKAALEKQPTRWVTPFIFSENTRNKHEIEELFTFLSYCVRSYCVRAVDGFQSFKKLYLPDETLPGLEANTILDQNQLDKQRQIGKMFICCEHASPSLFKTQPVVLELQLLNRWERWLFNIYWQAIIGQCCTKNTSLSRFLCFSLNFCRVIRNEFYLFLTNGDLTSDFEFCIPNFKVGDIVSKDTKYRSASSYLYVKNQSISQRER